jgi:hypothetical protein
MFAHVYTPSSNTQILNYIAHHISYLYLIICSHSLITYTSTISSPESSTSHTTAKWKDKYPFLSVSLFSLFLCTYFSHSLKWFSRNSRKREKEENIIYIWSHCRCVCVPSCDVHYAYLCMCVELWHLCSALLCCVLLFYLTLWSVSHRLNRAPLHFFAVNKILHFFQL